MITKDSGERQEFSTGARRDTESGKPDFSNIELADWDWFLMDWTELLSTIIEYPDADFETTITPDDENYGLISELFLNRMQALLERGAKKYGENNWQKGIPLKRIFGSLIRHLLQWRFGDTSEDHLAAVAVNTLFLMVTEHNVKNGLLPNELGNAGALEVLGERKK